ncbi:MAG: hypothetical protein H0U64_01055 [Gemmatimonadaceae bacterium]|nr:hypothetical protein [Gemmatimonadaceae bacterium]
MFAFLCGKGLLGQLGRTQGFHAEIEKINHIFEAPMRSQIKRSVVVYDYAASPPTYGDFFLTVMFARWLGLHAPVEFVIVSSERRADWRDVLDDKAQKALLDNQIHLARAVLKSVSGTVTAISYSGLKSYLRRDAANTFVPFEGWVRSRISVYSVAFNALNSLLATASDDLLSRFLLSYDELKAESPPSHPIGPYIAWHCRHNMQWCSHANLTIDAFAHLHQMLKAGFPDHEILIVSDSKGCAHVKEIADRLGVDCLYSKDFTNSFLEDVVLVFGSDFYFQFLAGGMGAIPLYSRMKFEIHCPRSNEQLWAPNMATPWQTAEQHWVVTSEMPTQLVSGKKS